MNESYELIENLVPGRIGISYGHNATNTNRHSFGIIFDIFSIEGVVHEEIIVCKDRM